MANKNSMYINNYEVLGYSTETTTAESKQNYLNYIQSLIDELIELKLYAETTDEKAPINMFFECQAKLVSFKNKLNAKTLAEWHTNVTYELEREVRELRNKIKLERSES